MDVLLVEQETPLRDAVRDGLRRAAFSVAAAPSAEDGLAMAEDRARAPAVLVTGIALGPGMDGFALVREVRRRWPSVAVVLLGDKTRGGLQGRRLGPRERFLEKPVPPEQVVSEVRNLTGRTGTRLQA